MRPPPLPPKKYFPLNDKHYLRALNLKQDPKMYLMRFSALDAANGLRQASRFSLFATSAFL